MPALVPRYSDLCDHVTHWTRDTSGLVESPEHGNHSQLLRHSKHHYGFDWLCKAPDNGKATMVVAHGRGNGLVVRRCRWTLSYSPHCCHLIYIDVTGCLEIK